jgi:hypothetical protein
VLRITSMTPVELAAAFGTGRAPQVRRSGSNGVPATSGTSSDAPALPILPACYPGPCWRGAAPGRGWRRPR